MKYPISKKAIFGFLVLLAVLCLCFVALAESSGKCGDNLTWILDDNDVLTISGTGKMGTGKMEDYGWGPWNGYNVKAVIIENGVTSIGEYAFYSCDSLTSISISKSVTSIGDGAFFGCTSLKSVSIPNSVTSIGDSAFSG